MTPSSIRWVCGVELAEGGNIAGMAEPYWRGMPIDVVQPLKIVVVQPGVITDMDVIWGGVPIVSQRAHEVIRDLVADDVQCIPLSFDEDRQAWWIYNVLRHADCMDEERSDFEPARKGTRWFARGHYRTVTMPIIRADRVPHARLFRMQKWPIPLIATLKLFECVQRAGLRGWLFHPLEHSH